MINSRLVDTIRSRPAILVAVGLAMVFVLGLAAVLRPRRATSDRALYTNGVPAPAIEYARDPGQTATSGPKPMRLAPTTNRPFAGVHIHTELPPDQPPLQIYAPAGRLLRCFTINTIDSANIETPIIALVSDDLWHDGHLVIPAGSEVHGRASVDRLRDCIVASGSWTVVWQSGLELVVQGIALDRDEHPSGSRWGITDGRSGLTGQVLKSDSLAEAKLFVATFLSGVASGLQETRNTILDTQVRGTVRNGALNGASEVMNAYARQILDTIRKEGVFVRVPAGKQMYLYVDQTIDLSQAKIGSRRLPSGSASIVSQNSNKNTKP